MIPATELADATTVFHSAPSLSSGQGGIPILLRKNEKSVGKK